jgi:hypothetical protein
MHLPVAVVRILAGLVLIALSLNLVAQPGTQRTAQAEITAMPVGTKLDVRLKGGERVKGRLVSVDEMAFTLTLGKSAGSSRKIGFDDVDRFTAHPPTHTPIAAWVVTGAIAAVVVAVVVGLAIYFHNE